MFEGMDDTTFIEWCYQTLLGRSSDTDGKQHYIQELQRGTPRSSVIDSFIHSNEFIRFQSLKKTPTSARNNGEFVEWAFQTVVGRSIDDQAKTAFMETLQSGMSRLAVLESLLSSEEYRVRMALNSTYQFVPPGHFYSPIPSDEDIDQHQHFDWDPTRIPGVDLQFNAQLALLERFVPFYRTLPFTPEESPHLRYKYNNPSYSYADGIFLHCMLRHMKPRRIIEVGSGNSSCVILDTNELFFDNQVNCLFIEPYPEYMQSLLKEGDQHLKLMPQRLRDVPLATFEQLEVGDILLIDSTHVSKLNSDVNRIFFQILPVLNKGVLIHFHDVFYPFEYSTDWLSRGWA